MPYLQILQGSSLLTSQRALQKRYLRLPLHLQRLQQQWFRLDRQKYQREDAGAKMNTADRPVHRYLVHQYISTNVPQPAASETIAQRWRGSRVSQSQVPLPVIQMRHHIANSLYQDHACIRQSPG